MNPPSLIVAATFTPGFAQRGRGTILGSVTDASGAIIPGATVTVTNTATNVVTTSVSNDDGNFTVPNLQVGGYNVAVAKDGFKKALRTGITLEVDQRAEINITLETGAVSETIEVTSQAPLVDTTTATFGKVIESRRVTELPVNGRNALSLVLLAPAVQSGVGPTASGFADRGTQVSMIRINGSPFATNNLVVDGLSSVNAYLPDVNINPNVDSVQEFKVQTNTMSAEYGFTLGGVVNLVTKSGTNNYHGTAFEQFRNQMFRANNYFPNARGQQRGVFRFHQFGGTFGGPVIKQKTFFFADYQGHREVNYLAGRAITIPTEAQRRGDFRGLLNASGQPVTLYDPFTTRPQGTGSIRDPLSCNGVANVICPNRIDPVAAKLVSFLPAPNRPGEGPAGINNFVFAPENLLNSNQWSVRLDHRFSERHNLFGRVTRNTGDNSNTSPFGNIADNVLGTIKHSAINVVPATLSQIKTGGKLSKATTRRRCCDGARA